MVDCESLMRKHKPLAVYFFNKLYLSKWNSIKHMFPEYIDTDDVEQACYVGLWRALETFEGSKGNFSTWVLNHIRSKVNGLYRLKRDMSYFTFTDMDAKNPISSEASGVSFESLVDDRSIPDPIDKVYVENVSKFARSLLCLESSKKCRQVCLDRLDGYTFPEISLRSGLTKQRVHQIWGRFVKRVKSRVTKSGYDYKVS